MGRIYIITGGSGFIGTHLVESLLKQDDIEKIYILDLNPPKIKDTIIEFHKCDVREPINFDREFKNAVFIYLAALCKEPGYGWEDYFKTNYYGTKKVVEYAKKNNIKNIIF